MNIFCQKQLKTVDNKN